MKELKIFLASSEELADDRLRIGDFVSNRLNAIYEPQGIRLKLAKWEDMDDAYTGERTQDMYNRSVCDSDIFLAIFHRRAGKYTLEELHKAFESLKTCEKPRICIYFKHLEDISEQTSELANFKKRLLNDKQHFPAPDYEHIDSLFLNIAMQVQRLVNSSLNLESENGMVTLAGQRIADLRHVPFAANNGRLQKLKSQLDICEKTIATLEQEAAGRSNPVIEARISLTKKTIYKLQEKINKQENQLLSTAFGLMGFWSILASNPIRKAITLFESGDNKEADALLASGTPELEAQHIKLGLGNAGKAAFQALRSNIEKIGFKRKKDK